MADQLLLSLARLTRLGAILLVVLSCMLGFGIMSAPGSGWVHSVRSPSGAKPVLWGIGGVVAGPGRWRSVITWRHAALSNR